MTDEINILYTFYENNQAALAASSRAKKTKGSGLLPKKTEAVVIADFSENISNMSCLAFSNTLVFGQYISPQFIHIFIHTQICMYIHT